MTPLILTYLNKLLATLPKPPHRQEVEQKFDPETIQRTLYQESRIIKGKRVRDHIEEFIQETLGGITHSRIGHDPRSIWGNRPVIGITAPPLLAPNGTPLFDESLSIFDTVVSRALSYYQDTAVESYRDPIKGYQDLCINGITYRLQLEGLAPKALFINENIRFSIDDSQGVHILDITSDAQLMVQTEQDGIVIPTLGNPVISHPDEYCHFLIETRGLLPGKKPKICPIFNFEHLSAIHFFNYIKAFPKEWTRILSNTLLTYPRKTAQECFKLLETACRQHLDENSQDRYLNLLKNAQGILKETSKQVQEDIIQMNTITTQNLRLSPEAIDLPSVSSEYIPPPSIPDTQYKPSQLLKNIIHLQRFLKHASQKQALLTDHLTLSIYQTLQQQADIIMPGLGTTASPPETTDLGKLCTYSEEILSGILKNSNNSILDLAVEDLNLVYNAFFKEMPPEDALTALEKSYYLNSDSIEKSTLMQLYIRVAKKKVNATLTPSEDGILKELFINVKNKKPLALDIESPAWGSPGSVIRRIVISLAYMETTECKFLKPQDSSYLADCLAPQRKAEFHETLLKKLNTLAKDMIQHSPTSLKFHLNENEIQENLKLGKTTLTAEETGPILQTIEDHKEKHKEDIIAAIIKLAGKQWEEFSKQWGLSRQTPTEASLPLDNCLQFCSQRIDHLPPSCMSEEKYYIFQVGLSKLTENFTKLSSRLQLKQAENPLVTVCENLKQFQEKFQVHNVMVRKKRFCDQLQANWNQRLNSITRALGYENERPSLEQLEQDFRSKTDNPDNLFIQWKEVREALNNLLFQYQSRVKKLQHRSQNSKKRLWNKPYDKFEWGSWKKSPYETIQKLQTKFEKIEKTCSEFHTMNQKNNSMTNYAIEGIGSFMKKLTGGPATHSRSVDDYVRFCNQSTEFPVEKCNKYHLELFRETIKTMESWTESCKEHPLYPQLEQSHFFSLNYTTIYTKIQRLESKFSAKISREQNLSEINDLFREGCDTFTFARNKAQAKEMVATILDNDLRKFQMPVLTKSLEWITRGAKAIQDLSTPLTKKEASEHYYLNLSLQEIEDLKQKLKDRIQEIEEQESSKLRKTQENCQEMLTNWHDWAVQRFNISEERPEESWESLTTGKTEPQGNWRAATEKSTTETIELFMANLKAYTNKKDYPVASRTPDQTNSKPNHDWLRDLFESASPLIEQTKEFLRQEKFLQKSIPFYTQLKSVVKEIQDLLIDLLLQSFRKERITPEGYISLYTQFNLLRSPAADMMFTLSRLRILETTPRSNPYHTDAQSVLPDPNQTPTGNDAPKVSIDEVPLPTPGLEEFWVEMVARQLPFKSDIGLEKSVKALIDYDKDFTQNEIDCIAQSMLWTDERLSKIETLKALQYKILRPADSENISTNLLRYLALSKHIKFTGNKKRKGIKTADAMRRINNLSLKTGIRNPNQMNFQTNPDFFYIACIQIREGHIEKVPPAFLSHLEMYLNHWKQSDQPDQPDQKMIEAMAIWGILADSHPKSGNNTNIQKIICKQLKSPIDIPLLDYLSPTFDWISNGLKTVLESAPEGGTDLADFKKWAPPSQDLPDCNGLKEIPYKFKKLHKKTDEDIISKFSKLFFESDPLDPNSKLKEAIKIKELTPLSVQVFAFQESCYNYLYTQKKETGNLFSGTKLEPSDPFVKNQERHTGKTQTEKVTEWIINTQADLLKEIAYEAMINNELITPIPPEVALEALSRLIELSKLCDPNSSLERECLAKAGSIFNNILHTGKIYMNQHGLPDSSPEWTLDDFMSRYSQLLKPEHQAIIETFMDRTFKKWPERVQKLIVEYSLFDEEQHDTKTLRATPPWHIDDSQAALLMMPTMLMGHNSNLFEKQRTLYIFGADYVSSKIQHISNALALYATKREQTLGENILLAEKGHTISTALKVIAISGFKASIPEIFKTIYLKSGELEVRIREKTKKKSGGTKTNHIEKWITKNLETLMTETSPSKWLYTIRIMSALKDNHYIVWDEAWTRAIEERFRTVWTAETKPKPEELKDTYALMVDISTLCPNLKKGQLHQKLVEAVTLECFEKRAFSPAEINGFIGLANSILIKTGTKDKMLETALTALIKTTIAKATHPEEILSTCKAIGDNLPLSWQEIIRQAFIDHLQKAEDPYPLLIELTKAPSDTLEHYIWENSKKEIHDSLKKSPPTKVNKTFDDFKRLLVYIYTLGISSDKSFARFVEDIHNQIKNGPPPKSLEEYEDLLAICQQLVNLNVIKNPAPEIDLFENIAYGFFNPFLGEEALSKEALYQKREALLKTYKGLHQGPIDTLKAFFDTIENPNPESTKTLTHLEAHHGARYLRHLEKVKKLDQSLKTHPGIRRIRHDLQYIKPSPNLSMTGPRYTTTPKLIEKTWQHIFKCVTLFETICNIQEYSADMNLPKFLTHWFEKSLFETADDGLDSTRLQVANTFKEHHPAVHQKLVGIIRQKQIKGQLNYGWEG